MNLTDVQGIFHPAAGHGTLSKTDHVLGHKAGLNKYKKTEIIPCTLSDHSTIKAEINNKRNSKKYSDTWRLNNILVHDQWVIKEIREEIKKFWNLMKMKAQPIRTYGTQQRQC
jgi:hypothetical protein